MVEMVCWWVVAGQQVGGLAALGLPPGVSEEGAASAGEED